MSTHGPSHERPWAPAELDALEDRLEHDDDALPWPTELSTEARDRVRARAQQYRALQHYTRAALDVAPPSNVLAAVMQEARASCAAVPAVTPPAVEPTRAGLWARLRRVWWIPSLATAGAGALAATLVIRQAEHEPAAVAQAPATKAEAPQERGAFELRRDPAIAQAAEPDAATKDAIVRGDGLLDAGRRREANADELAGVLADELAEADDRDASSPSGEVATRTKGTSSDAAPTVAGATRNTATPRPASDAQAEEQRGGEQERKTKRAAETEPVAPKVPTAKPSSGAAPPAPPREAPGPGSGGGPAMAPAEQLARGDAARRRNDCGAARSDYLAVVERGTAKQRARARAGLALCAERSGSEKTAAELLSQARADDPGIDAWVDAERSR